MPRLPRLAGFAVLAACLAAPGLAAQPSSPPARESFRFERFDSLEQMQAALRSAFRVGSPRAVLRRQFVEEGGATLVAHPSQAGTEKYIYDIDLCGYYVWRWNVSADFGREGELRQIYLNGEPVLADGESEPPFDATAARQRPGTRIYQMSRPRPEAARGEASLAFILIDGDGDLATSVDQRLFGGGPTRPHPADMGRLRGYNVAWWRSIFDSDAAGRITPYSGDCAAAERALARG